MFDRISPGAWPSGLASAHTTVTNGPYNVEIGWLNEPPIVGQMNAIIMNLTTSDGKSTPVTNSISGLTLTVSYGGQSKVLTLQPLGEDTPGNTLPQSCRPLQVSTPWMSPANWGRPLSKWRSSPRKSRRPTRSNSRSGGCPSNGNSFGLGGWLAIAGLVIGLAALALALLGPAQIPLTRPWVLA